jgi:nicotinic acid mononucleotide adenylyltransferase
MAVPNLDTKNNKNKIIFTIGRMNPPTPGHMLLIEKLIQRAASLGESKIGIILSHSQNIPKNPFSCNEKRNLLISSMIDSLKQQMKQKTYVPPISHSSIDAVSPIIICMNDPTPEAFGKHPILKSINALLANYEYYPETRMELIIGEDRAQDYEWIKDSLANRETPVILEIGSIPRPEGAISATEIRGYAMNGDWTNFYQKMRPSGMSEEKIREMYSELNELLTSSGPVKKRGKTGGRKTGGRKTGGRKTGGRKTKGKTYKRGCKKNKSRKR